MTLILGITGGIASGKSLVTEMLCRLGAWRLDADQAGHEALREPAVIDQLVARWGPDILVQPAVAPGVAVVPGVTVAPGGAPPPPSASRTVDRKRVAAIVFARTPAGSRELAFLESVTHPRITDKLRRQVQQAELASPPPPALVLDAAVMFRAGWRTMCDWLLFVEAPRELRLQRAISRGWTAEEFAAREAAQEPVEWKRWQADVMMDNSGSELQALSQLRAFWTALRLPFIAE